MSLFEAIKSRKLSMLVATLLGFLAMSLLPASQASAQRLDINPAEKFIIAPGGVDMRTGRYVYNQTDLAVGSGADGISLSRILPDYAAYHANPFSNFSHNWDIWLVQGVVNATEGEGGERMHIHIGGRSLTFYSEYLTGNLGYSGDGPTILLTQNGPRTDPATVFTLRDGDGTIYNFRPIGSLDCSGGYNAAPPRRCAYVASMVQPDGTRYDFSYAATGATSGNQSRLARVTSSRGFVLILEGTSTYVTKACVINATRSVVPAANTCPSNAVATATYSYNFTVDPAKPRLVSVVDPVGKQWGFTYNLASGPITMGFVKPDETAPWLVNSLGGVLDEEDAPQEIVLGQSFADGTSYGYSFNFAPVTTSRPNPPVVGGTYTDSAGKSVLIEFAFPIKPGSRTRTYRCDYRPCEGVEPENWFLTWTYQTTPGPVRVVDQLGRESKFDYCDPVVMAGLPSWEPDRCAVVPLVSATDPEGLRTEFKYGDRRNVIEVKQIAKPGSTPAPAPLIVSATYDCSNPASCTKPVTSTDAMTNVTNRTYAAGHGGLLTEMLPPPTPGAARPLKVFTYVQRSAWAYDANGVLVEQPAVWVPAGSTDCQSVPGSTNPVCDPAAPQVITVLEYGAVGTADALLVKGQAVTADSVTLRTCYSYDAAGRRISQTDPRANLGACP